MNEPLNFKKKKEISTLESFQWVECSPVCTKVIDLDFNFHYMSAAGVKDLKIDNIEEFYGKPYPFQIYPGPYKETMRNSLNKVRETGKIIEEEIAVMTTKGEKLWYNTTFVPVKDEQGQIQYFIVVSMNITELKKKEKEILANIKGLEQMNEVMTGRELRIIEIKEEVNKLSAELGRPKPYT